MRPIPIQRISLDLIVYQQIHYTSKSCCLLDAYVREEVAGNNISHPVLQVLGVLLGLLQGCVSRLKTMLRLDEHLISGYELL